MKIDLYTKTVLTAIAVFLGMLVFQNMNFITPAQANVAQIPQPQAKTRDTIAVNIVQLNGKDLFPRSIKLDGVSKSVFPISMEYHDLLSPLEVQMNSSYAMPVNITHVNSSNLSGTYGNLPVKIY